MMFYFLFLFLSFKSWAKLLNLFKLVLLNARCRFRSLHAFNSLLWFVAVVFWYFSFHCIKIWDARTWCCSQMRTKLIYHAGLNFVFIRLSHMHYALTSCYCLSRGCVRHSAFIVVTCYTNLIFCQRLYVLHFCYILLCPRFFVEFLLRYETICALALYHFVR